MQWKRAAGLVLVALFRVTTSLRLANVSDTGRSIGVGEPRCSSPPCRPYTARDHRDGRHPWLLWQVWHTAATAALVEVTPARAAVPGTPTNNTGAQAAVPRVTRSFPSVETGQVGMLWRICSRLFWARAGNN